MAKWGDVPYKLLFLVIDDSSIKASINLHELTNLTIYTCLDADGHPMLVSPPSKSMIFPFTSPHVCNFSHKLT